MHSSALQLISFTSLLCNTEPWVTSMHIWNNATLQIFNFVSWNCAIMQLCNLCYSANLQLFKLATLQLATLQTCNSATLWPCKSATFHLYKLATQQISKQLHNFAICKPNSQNLQKYQIESKFMRLQLLEFTWSEISSHLETF